MSSPRVAHRMPARMSTLLGIAAIALATAVLAACTESHGTPKPAALAAVRPLPLPRAAQNTVPCGSAACILQDADVVFQPTAGVTSEAIKLATHSAFSHVGIVVRTVDGPLVYEAIGPVKLTPLAQWVAHDAHGTFVAKRLKATAHTLTSSELQKMRSVGERFNGKPYDFGFDWSDEKLYCSELVWKIYHEGAGVDLAQPRPLRVFDLSHPKVKAALSHQYGDRIPLDAPMISPGDLEGSPLLETVYQQ
jgi:cell wall-associated NlpC family hydrolase